MSTIKITDPGPFTTIQDLGRFGFQRYGMAPSGAMDEVSFQLGNYLLGNEPNAAAIEFTLKGPELEIKKETLVAVTGGRCQVKVNGELSPMYAPLHLCPGDQISFSGIQEGLRGYLCVLGGVDVPLVMQSRSTYLKGQIGGIEGRQVKKGDTLDACSYSSLDFSHIDQRSPLPTKYWPTFISPYEIDVILGPQVDYFSEQGVNTFLSQEYQISDAADRMGYRLNGPEIEHQGAADIISDGIPLGGIQVPGHGQPIIMMKDRQTTGGYPKIATVASYEIYKLGQAKPGDRIKFNKISLEEARQKKHKHDLWFDNLVDLIKQPVKNKQIINLHFKSSSYKVTIQEL
ncbi:biotin-dependent carboxyltransferase family protein [Natranaerobius thermophilus]|uniref:Urea amidolyase related protein n=1 Tax=Natranaerobius thermophilus (strain ATCC BAA-1301 / DSM 18059 / JW/NM-WN-LF) TaxID=457570 RepID=B2A1I9_NATTJ|nr:biotin-dependent carboxyltransferase family protein [Natranaerobius thermophilus]ACB84729.1 urea amidolyase related protein [Natranaerobius thermophilus JW/NM-WN-LF]